MKQKTKTKALASFQLTIIFMSVFSFSYIISESNSHLERVNSNEPSTFTKIKTLLKIISNKIKEPIIPLTSAASDSDTVCCKVAGIECHTATRGECENEDGTSYDESCNTVASCVSGCCYDATTGDLSTSVLEENCVDGEWNGDDPLCETTYGTTLGCCADAGSYFESKTEQWCYHYSKNYGSGNDPTWTSELSDVACIALRSLEKEGACVNDDGSCTFTTGSECQGNTQTFNENFLCSAGSVINSICGMPDPKNIKTTYVEGKSGVYFLDNCSQPANIYDNSNISNPNYWTKIISPSKSCGATSNDGNLESTDCGNCNVNKGTSHAKESSEDIAEIGDYYCGDVNCYFDYNNDGTNETFLPSSSWCMYDGVVGNGNDIVGSSHWRYYCDLGEIKIELCNADPYRSYICTGGEYSANEIMYAKCEPNSWQTCLNLNAENLTLEELTTKCNNNPVCEMTEVNLGGKYFNFSFCTPSYPPGLDVGIVDNILEGIDTDTICDMGDFTCSVPTEPQGVGSGGIDGGCMYAKDPDTGELVNVNCTSKEFLEQMNDFCRSLGDCGLSVNINGALSKGFDVDYQFTDMENGDALPEASRILYKDYIIGNTSMPSLGYNNTILSTYNRKNISGIIALTDYTELAESLGIELVPLSEELKGASAWFSFLDGISEDNGITNLALLIGGGTVFSTILSAALTTSANPGITIEIVQAITGLPYLIGPFIQFAALAAAGAVIGYAFSNILGIESKTTADFLTAAGALAGGAISVALSTTVSEVALGFGIGGAVIIAVMAIVGGIYAAAESDCAPINITFDCQPYIPPTVDGNTCAICDEDPLLCNEYRCSSLGANCYYYEDNEKGQQCQAIEDDGMPPHISVITSGKGVTPIYLYDSTGTDPKEVSYTSSTISGAIASPDDKDSFEANDIFAPGITISEPAICKYSVDEELDYENMEKFGSSSYIREQILTGYRLPDLTAGVAEPGEWDEEIEFYIKCEDTYGDISATPFVIKFSVSQGPDNSAPSIKSYTPESGGLVGIQTNKTNIKIMTTESATCRWSEQLVSYSEMTNNFSCLGISGRNILNVQEPSICEATLPTDNETNTFYISCADKPWELSIDKKKIMTPKKYTLVKPSELIQIKSIFPDYDQEVSSIADPFEYEITTSGGGENHECIWSKTGYESMNPIQSRFVKKENSATKHIIHPFMQEGENTIYINCSDETGDTVSQELTVEISVDRSAPEVTRIWQTKKTLHLMTDEDSECRYSTENCNFIWSEAPKMSGDADHTLSVTKGQTYYIKCEDEYKTRPSFGCSAEVVAL